jgi:predicted transposase YbfD/YdcC
MSEMLLSSFAVQFAALEDPRVERTRRHKLLDMVFIALCAVVSGANDFVAMEKFGHSKRAWLEKYLTLDNGIPTHDTFTRVFSALDPQSFVDCFLSWVDTLQVSTAGKVVAIDGKTARATLDRAKGQQPLHVVSAWAVENHLVLGQEVVEDKSNEITAIPKLLEVLELTGALVTIDAMGCQKDIAAKIRERKADYVLAVKGNQEHLEEDVLAAFAAYDEGLTRPTVTTRETKEKGHGRQEHRCFQAMAAPKSLRHREEWLDLKSICRVTRTYQERGAEKAEVRYFISSREASAPLLPQAIRDHWGVENGLHWSLDMFFGEDQSRARADHAPANLALLRRWVLSLLRRNTTVQGGLEKKRLQAAWNDNAREKIIGLF